jgi:hypothetical protein
MEFIDKADILGELWINYKNDKDFINFIEYNDLGLPLAFFLSEGMVIEISDEAVIYITETFNLFISALGIKEEDIKPGMQLADILSMVVEEEK